MAVVTKLNSHHARHKPINGSGSVVSHDTVPARVGEVVILRV